MVQMVGLTFLGVFLYPSSGQAGQAANFAVRDMAYYPNCDWARDAGVAPIRRGEPGYRDALDADNDGIACEPYRGRY